MLIAPFEGSFAAAMAAAAQAAGWKTALADRQGGRDDKAPEALEGSMTLPWNPASYISAGALCLSAASALGEPDCLVLICDPEPDGVSLFDGSVGQLGSSIEASVSGPVFLAREMTRRFEARKSGKILLVSVQAATGASAALSPGAFSTLVNAAFQGLGEGLFRRARGAEWSAWGLAERSAKPDAAAEFALRLLDEQKTTKSGRWLPYNGKAGLFGVF